MKRKYDFVRKNAGPARRRVKARYSSSAVSVSTVKKMIRKRGEQLFTAGGNNTTFTGAFYVSHSNFDSQAELFGTAADDVVGNKIYWEKTQIDMRLSLENPDVTTPNELSTVTYTCFLVQLRDECNDGVTFNPGLGTLAMVNSIDYYQNQGYYFINPSKFKILRRKQFTLTNNGASLSVSSGQSQYGTDHAWSWVVPVRQTIQNPNGSWKAMKSGFDPSKTYYTLIFNNDGAADLQAGGLKYNLLNTFRTVGSV